MSRYTHLLNLIAMTSTFEKLQNGESVDYMMDNLIACFGEISAFNDALLEHPEFAELSGMTGIAELVIDRIINRFEHMIEEQQK